MGDKKKIKFVKESHFSYGIVMHTAYWTGIAKSTISPQTHDSEFVRNPHLTHIPLGHVLWETCRGICFYVDGQNVKCWYSCSSKGSRTLLPRPAELLPSNEASWQQSITYEVLPYCRSLVTDANCLCCNSA